MTTVPGRTVEVSLGLRAADGSTLSDVEVTVAQRRHQFLFGCIGFDLVPLANGEVDEASAPGVAALAGLWLDVFNFATLPFYWAQFEPVPGHPDTTRLRQAARWFVERGCAVKGHPLVWHTLAPTWLLDLPTSQIVTAQRDRIDREVRDFAGLVDMWDVVNEAVIMPNFDRYDNGLTRVCRELGRIGTVRMAFAAAQAANPRATLILNDFDTSAALECLVEGCLEAGVPIHAIGLQSHMHQGYWGEEVTLSALERFARYGLPIHLTETTLVSGHLMPPDVEDLNDYRASTWPSTPDGEERQADDLVRHYRTLLSHPAVAAITYWGLSDTGAWLGAPAGLVRGDGTPKPAYDALRRLVRGEWWVDQTRLATDEAGRVTVRGFPGEYELTARGQHIAFALDPGGPRQVDLRLV